MFQSNIQDLVFVRACYKGDKKEDEVKKVISDNEICNLVLVLYITGNT